MNAKEAVTIVKSKYPDLQFSGEVYESSNLYVVPMYPKTKSSDTNIFFEQHQPSNVIFNPVDSLYSVNKISKAVKSFNPARERFSLKDFSIERIAQ